MRSRGCAGGGYFTVLDWVVGPWFLDVYRAEATRTGIPLDYVLLRPSEEAVIARSRARAVNPIADYTYLRPLYEQLGNVRALDGHVVDTTTMSLEATIATLLAGLAEGRFRLE